MMDRVCVLRIPSRYQGKMIVCAWKGGTFVIHPKSWMPKKHDRLPRRKGGCLIREHDYNKQKQFLQYLEVHKNSNRSSTVVRVHTVVQHHCNRIFFASTN